MSFTDGPLGSYGFGEGTVHAKTNYVVADRQHQELAAQAKELHALLCAGSHENAVRTVQDLLDAANRAKQPQLAAGECWVRAKLDTEQCGADRYCTLVRVGRLGQAVQVSSEHVVQGNPPVPGIDQQYAGVLASLALQNLHAMLGVATQDAAIEQIKDFKLIALQAAGLAAPVHATKISVVTESDVASMTDAQRASIVGPNQQDYGKTYSRWVPGQGWCRAAGAGGGDMAQGCCSAVFPCSHQQRDPYSLCEVCAKAAGYPQPNAPQNAVLGPTAAEKAVAAVQVAQEPAKPPSEPLTPGQLAKVRVDDYVLVRLKVKNVANPKSSCPVLAIFQDGENGARWLREDQVVGHEPAPPNPVEAPCRAKHPTMGNVQVLHLDEDEALVKDAEGLRRIVLVKNLERLPDN